MGICRYFAPLVSVWIRPSIVALAILTASNSCLHGQSMVRLAGNTRPEAIAANDLGPVEDALILDHVLLELQRPPAQEAELRAWMDGLEDKSSENYHHWLTAEEFGWRFGVPAADVARVTGWLTESGLTLNGVYPSQMTIDFSATARQVREVFGTEIHVYEVRGVRHIANASDPLAPAALAAKIAGPVSLHDFHPRPLLRTLSRPDSGGAFTNGSGVAATYPVTASDVATIYNLTPLFKAGYTGKGQTIALLEDSNVYSKADWSVFRAAFGLSGYSSGSLAQVHPASPPGVGNCVDPGVISGWDEEPILDAEYASAAAPGAAIEVDSCKSTTVTDGVTIALENLVNAAGAHPAVLSVSYGDCEAGNGAAANAALADAYAQAAAEGIAVFAAAGDAGAAFCDAGASAAAHGLGANAYASTAYNVAVGGTDFSDTYSGTERSYWAASNSGMGESAKSYIPEIPWDDSCASPLIAAWHGYASNAGAVSFCLVDQKTVAAYQTTEAGGGGPSGCASGSPALGLVVSGGCRGTAKPAWQAVAGNPADGVRDLPDVALFAADGVWNHAYIFCDSNLSDEDGVTCKTGAVGEWSQGGGTSFSAPIMAGIQALVAQKWGRHGNPNVVYYKLAAAQFASASLKKTCNAMEGAASGSSCVFHDVTEGSSDVNCKGQIDCDLGVLSTKTLQFTPAYAAVAGWDFATGLGSVNAYNLVMNPAW